MLTPTFTTYRLFLVTGALVEAHHSLQSRLTSLRILDWVLVLHWSRLVTGSGAVKD